MVLIRADFTGAPKQSIEAAIVSEHPNRGPQSAVETDTHLATDESLTLAARSGDRAAFDELSRRHSKRIQRHVYRILGNWEDTEDVLQDSLLKAYRHIGEFRSDCKFSTWLTRIAINSSLMTLRKRRAHSETSYDDAGSDESLRLKEFPDSSPGPELLCAERQMEELLRNAILQLPGSFRSVTELYHSRECSTLEVAQALGISVAAVKSRLLRARRALRASLPVNIKGHFPNFKIWTRAQADIDRVCSIWRDCLAQSGGPFLFGERTMADAMYAPVVTRFMTYDVKLEPKLAAYARTIMTMPEMVDWIEAAKAEPADIEELEVEY